MKISQKIFYRELKKFRTVSMPGSRPYENYELIGLSNSSAKLYLRTWNGYIVEGAGGVFEVDTEILVLFPFLEFLFLGTFLMFYCKIIWLHVEHAMTHRLDSKQENHLSRTQSTSPSKPTPQDQQNPKNQDPHS